MMWLIYDSDGQLVGTLNENAMKYTSIPEMLERDFLIIPVKELLSEEEQEKLWNEQLKRRHGK